MEFAHAGGYRRIGLGRWSPLAQAVARQAEIAIDESDVTIFLTDAKTRSCKEDHDVAAVLASQKQVVLAVNKVDDFSCSHQLLAEFYELGLGEPIPISAANGLQYRRSPGCRRRAPAGVTERKEDVSIPSPL